MRHRYPLHVHISTLFLALILVICGVLTAIGYKLSSELLETAAADLTTRISREARIEMQRIVEPAEVATRLLSLQQITRAQSLKERLKSLEFVRQALDSSPALSSLYVGYANGDFFLVGRIGHGAESETARAPAGARYVVQSIEQAGGKPRGRFIYLDADLHTLRDDDRPDYAAAYDPRQRIWFTQAMASPTQIATPPYLFFSSRQVGLTLAKRSGDGQAVAGADIQLQSLGQTLAQQKVTPGNELVIVDADGYALAYEDVASLVRPSATADGKPSLARLDELGVPALIPLLASVRQRAENPLAREPSTLRIDIDGTPWRAIDQPFGEGRSAAPVHGHRGSRERVDGRRGAVDRTFGDRHSAGATADDSVHLVARAQHFTLACPPGQGGRQDPPLRLFGSDRRQFCNQ
jgi:hypothetical protein